MAKETCKEEQTIVKNESHSIMRWGRMAEKTLIECNQKFYKELERSEQLIPFLENIDIRFNDYFVKVQGELLEHDPVPKTDDFLTRVRHLNWIRSQAMELAVHEIIDPLRG